MKSLLRLLLKSQHQRNRCKPTQTEKGMTLIELLIGTVMAFLILTPMLAFVVDMLNTDRREQVKANNEQDIQAAVDFIAQDLSQAIYIYDNSATNGIPKISSFLPATTNQTPILVFWKRQLQKNALPIAPTAPDTPAPKTCDSDTPDPDTPCNDTYVLSLVAYYQINDNDPASIWCQPSGGKCPTRIVRYQIRDGLKDPLAAPASPYYTSTSVETGQKISAAYNPSFDISKPSENVTLGSAFWDPQSQDVLVNYIDHNEVPLADNQCQTALSNPRTTDSSNSEIEENTLKITAPTNSFYACVDTARNLARVTIRGNSLRRLQNAADYDKNKSAFFPTASVQVQGLGARGK